MTKRQIDHIQSKILDKKRTLIAEAEKRIGEQFTLDHLKYILQTTEDYTLTKYYRFGYSDEAVVTISSPKIKKILKKIHKEQKEVHDKLQAEYESVMDKLILGEASDALLLVENFGKSIK